LRRSRLDRPAIIIGIAAAAIAMMPVQAWALMNADAARAAVAAPAQMALPAETTPAATSVDHDVERLRVLLDADQQRKGNEDPARDRFEQAHAAQAAARQDVRQPATTRWAVLIGINEHLGRVSDNVGSRQDAEELRAHLLAQGWLDDHILLLTDRNATGEAIIEGLRWLGRQTDENSVGVVHYSGHSKKWYGEDHDGDGEVTDEGLWPTDDAFIVDSQFVALLADVDAAQLWVSISSCNSAGFNDPGLERPGRILTFSSTETQKSYEDPSVANSVWGHYLLDQGLLQGFGDLNRDGDVTVEEAFNFATPRAAQRTEGQRYGRQEAVVVDHVDGDFSLQIPPPPPQTEPEEDADRDGDGSDEQQDGLLCVLICQPSQPATLQD